MNTKIFIILILMSLFVGLFPLKNGFVEAASDACCALAACKGKYWCPTLPTYRCPGEIIDPDCTFETTIGFVSPAQCSDYCGVDRCVSYLSNCCGNDICEPPGETCNNCPVDCGICPTPSLTPTPTPTPVVCQYDSQCGASCIRCCGTYPYMWCSTINYDCSGSVIPGCITPTPTLAPGVPTPTPTPTPAPPPWGGCGSCSSGCNGDSSKSSCWDGSSYSCQPASECVLAPNGICWWDPGKCQNAWVEPGSDGQNCQPDDVMYFTVNGVLRNPNQGEGFETHVVSNIGYMYIALDITRPSNPSGVTYTGSSTFGTSVPGGGHWIFPISNAESGDTPYLFEFSHNSRSQYCVSKALFVPLPSLKAWMKVVGGDVHSNRR